MMKYLIILALVVLAWCPWLSAEEASKIIDARVAEMLETGMGLCDISPIKDSITKVPFGYTEKVFYDCTVTEAEYGVLKSTDVAFVTFYKGIIGMPGVTLKIK